MNARGERILIFGDSLTHTGSDTGPEIAQLDGSEVNSSAPGAVLGAILLQQGAAAVQTDSRVGRSAVNFWNREDTGSLFAADQAFAPTQVVIMLGTNDIGMDSGTESAAMQQIYDAYKTMGATVWGVGPFTYAPPGDALNASAGATFDAMKSVFGTRMIDGRPLSVQVGRAGDGVHFGPTAAQETGLNIADQLLSLNPWPFWQTLAIGAGVLGAALIGLSVYQKRTGHSLFGVSDEEYWASLKARKRQPSIGPTIAPQPKPKLKGVGERISTKPPAEMSKDQIVRELDRLAVRRGHVDADLVESGRGGEKVSSIRTRNEPVSKRLRAIEEREDELSREYSKRSH